MKQALKWWNKLRSWEKIHYCFQYLKGQHHLKVTDQEILEMYDKQN